MWTVALYSCVLYRENYSIFETIIQVLSQCHKLVLILEMHRGVISTHLIFFSIFSGIPDSSNCDALMIDPLLVVDPTQSYEKNTKYSTKDFTDKNLLLQYNSFHIFFRISCFFHILLSYSIIIYLHDFELNQRKMFCNFFSVFFLDFSHLMS